MTKKILFSQEEIANMDKLRNEGLTYTQIGEIYGVCWATVSRVFKENNFRSSHPSLTEERKKKICDLYLKYGVKDRVISELHTTYTTIDSVLSEYGIYQNTNGDLSRHYTIDETYFDEINTSNKAYFLGLLFADGCCANKGYTIHISLQDQDCYILESLNREINSNRILKFKDYKSKNKNYSNQYELAITNKHMWNTLVGYGMVPNKSLKLNFPQNIPECFYKDFVRGYFDGDGHIAKTWKYKKIEIISNLDFCQFLQQYLSDKLNIKSTLYFGVNKNSTTRVLNISRKDSIFNFLDWIYNDAEMYLLRKKKIYDDIYSPKR